MIFDNVSSEPLHPPQISYLAQQPVSTKKVLTDLHLTTSVHIARVLTTLQNVLDGNHDNNYPQTLVTQLNWPGETTT